MASVTEVRLVDDLDGSLASSAVRFALDRKDFELDLSDKNASRLRQALEPFVKAARRATTHDTRRNHATPRQRYDRARAGEIRAWLINNGYKVSDRGRIPGHMLEAFETKTPAEPQGNNSVKQPPLPPPPVEPEVELPPVTNTEILTWWRASGRVGKQVTGPMRAAYRKEFPSRVHQSDLKRVNA